ncbi:MAG: hypothetical protein MZU84_02240 [Sphingobacterium sp.]|nr:hypothetical protein [Sphingobacterium sp.]
MVDLESVWIEKDRKPLREMLDSHFRYTNSQRAAMILDNWEAHLPLFVKVMPLDYRKVLGTHAHAGGHASGNRVGHRRSLCVRINHKNSGAAKVAKVVFIH